MRRLLVFIPRSIIQTAAQNFLEGHISQSIIFYRNLREAQNFFQFKNGGKQLLCVRKSCDF